MAEGGDDDQGSPRPLPALRFAGKLEQLKAGEFVAVSPSGAVIGAAAIKRRRALYVGSLAALSATAILINPLFGAVYVTSLGGLAWLRISRARSFNRIPRLITDGRYDDAERELDAAEKRRIRTPWKAALAAWRGTLAWRRGDLAAAVASAQRSLEIMPVPARGFAVLYWQNQLSLTALLFELGRRDEAEAAMARARKVPTGEWYAVQLHGLEAHRAFAIERHVELGSDDDLHDRAREALRYNHTGGALAALAWAYAQRGDEDMATHLIAEVPARLHFATAEVHARMYPRLWAWLGPRLPAPDAADDEL